MDFSGQLHLNMTRRRFFGRSAYGLGIAALSHLLNENGFGQDEKVGALPGLPHFAPKAKRVIYLFQSGAPSQLELFDYKPLLRNLRGTELPASVRQGQRLTTQTSTQASFPIAPSLFEFAQYGQSGAWVSELMPYTAK